MSNFSIYGKKLLIIGGNGYVGSAIARQAVSLGAKVTSVSRSGRPKTRQPWDSKVEWIPGDALKPESFEGPIRESDAVVHTVGVLLDSSFTKFKQPGDEGTYEVLNRDTAKAVGSLLNEIGGKKMVYISASQGAGFTTRYLDTKREAEEFLLQLPKVKVSILRPGFIYSSTDRPWTMPVKIGKDITSRLANVFQEMAGGNETLRSCAKKLEGDHSIDVNAVAVSALLSAFQTEYDGKILESQEMEKIWERFLMRRFQGHSK